MFEVATDAEFPRALRSVLEAGQDAYPNDGDLSKALHAAIRSTLAAPRPAAAKPTTDALHADNVTELPSPLASLSTEEHWIVTNLIEIIRHRPQGAIFHVAEQCIDAAIKEYRKNAEHRTPPPPHDNEEHWIDLLRFILRKGSPDDKTGIKANLNWGAGVRSARTPSTAPEKPSKKQRPG